jgi:hypothetical protein
MITIRRGHSVKPERPQSAQAGDSAGHPEPPVGEIQRGERLAGVHRGGQVVALGVLGVGDAELQEAAAPTELAEDAEEPVVVQAHVLEIDLEAATGAARPSSTRRRAHIQRLGSSQ